MIQFKLITPIRTMTTVKNDLKQNINVQLNFTDGNILLLKKNCVVSGTQEAIILKVWSANPIS